MQGKREEFTKFKAQMCFQLRTFFFKGKLLTPWSFQNNKQHSFFFFVEGNNSNYQQAIPGKLFPQKVWEQKDLCQILHMSTSESGFQICCRK